MKPLLVAALAAALAGLTGCDHTKSWLPTAPPTPSTTDAPDAPVAVTIVVSGKTSLTAVGETTQLTATATFSDGSIRGITGEAVWESGDPSILAVSPAGLVTVLRFGRAFVRANYDTKVGGQTIEATPPPPLTRASPAHERESERSSLHG
jgi:hypothetical protein